MRSELAAFGEMASHLANPLVLIGLALLLVFGVHRALLRSRILPPVDRRTSGVIVQSLLRYGFWIAVLLIALGIGYAGYKTYRETQPGIVNAETVSTAIAVLSKQLESKGLREQEYQDQIKALTEAVQALAKKQNAPGIKEALAALAQGQTGEAKAIFAKTVEAKANEGAAGAAANREAATAALHLGALAFLDNTEEALRWIRRAVELDPANAHGWNGLGLLYLRTGQLDQAEAALREAVTLGEANGDKKSLAIEKKLGHQEGMALAYGSLGFLYQKRGDLDRAEEMFKKSLAIEKKLGHQEGMADQYGNLGLLYKKRGELDRAEEMYKKALAIDEKLGRQEGMADQYGDLGFLYQKRGELDRAEEMYRKALAIDEKLGRQESMADQYGDLGFLYQKRGELDRAEEMYKRALAIDEKLGRQEGMADQYGDLGFLYETRGELDRAEEMYRKALALFKAVGAGPQVKQVQAWLDALNKSRGER